MPMPGQRCPAQGCRGVVAGPGPCPRCGRLLEPVPSRAAGWYLAPGRMGWTSDPALAKLRVAVDAGGPTLGA